jgi:hypothetical protein
MARSNRANFLDYVPVRQAESTLDPGGSLVLLLPKFGSGRLGRWWASVIGSRSTLKIHLDELGSRTWDAIDGRRAIGEIAVIVHTGSEEKQGPMYERCARFIRMLANAGAVSLLPPRGS